MTAPSPGFVARVTSHASWLPTCDSRKAKHLKIAQLQLLRQEEEGACWNEILKCGATARGFAGEHHTFMPPVTRRRAASSSAGEGETSGAAATSASAAATDVVDDDVAVCHLRPIGDSTGGLTLQPNETRILGRRDMECMISRMTRRTAHKARHLSRKQLQVSFDAQAGSCTVKWIGRSHESLLQRASSGAHVIIRRETLVLEAGDILWLHSFYSPLNSAWQPGGCAPGLVVELPPAVERHRARLQAAAREALVVAATSKTATVESVREAIERAETLHVPETPGTGPQPVGEYSPARARLAQLLKAQQERRRSLGLDDLAPPSDYLCPVTRDVMRHPVVASDGHSYERDALEEVLRSDGRSPLTRELLQPFFFPNHNLKKRIRDCASLSLPAPSFPLRERAHTPHPSSAAVPPLLLLPSHTPSPPVCLADEGEAEQYAVRGQKALRTSRRGPRPPVSSAP